MGVIILKVLVLMNPKFQWNMLTLSESTLLSRICIDSPPEFWMSVMNFRIKMFPLMKKSVSVHHPTIYNGLRDLTPMFLLIQMIVHFFFNSRIESREQNQPDENVIDSFMQWLQLLNKIKHN